MRFRYHRIVCGDWWVEDPASPSTTGSATCAAEHASVQDHERGHVESPTAYRHLAVIDYNTDPIVPGRGSGIFLHVSTGRPTLGCVSLPLPQLLRILRWLRPAAEPLIVIGTRATIRRF